MHIGEILRADCANGEGMRVSVFVSGCTNQCRGCFQPETWDFHYGEPYNEKWESYILTELAKPHYAGLTILGGEPFEPENQNEVAGLVLHVKKELPDKNIWIYTGFQYDIDLMPGGRKYTDYTGSILDNIDILVDGRFELSQKDVSLPYRGSRNQRIIDVRESRRSGSVALSPLNEQ